MSLWRLHGPPTVELKSGSALIREWTEEIGPVCRGLGCCNRLTARAWYQFETAEPDQTKTERAPGTVVALEWRNDHNGVSRKKREDDKPAAYPVVEFTSADGTQRTFQDSTGSNPPAYEEGERVEVLYHADSPEDARIKGFASLWLLPLIFGGIGLLIAGVGTAVALAMRGRS